MRILQKGDIQIYRKRCELPHKSRILHLANKVAPTFCTQKNGFKNATLTQWRINTNICMVGIWAEIIIRLDSYLETTHDTTVNTVWKKEENSNHLSNDNQLPEIGYSLLLRIEVSIFTQRGRKPLSLVKIFHRTISSQSVSKDYNYHGTMVYQSLPVVYPHPGERPQKVHYYPH